MIRVLLADDQTLVRAGFRALLDAQDDMQVVGEAVDGDDAVRLVARFVPDVVLMDIRMPRCDGLEATRRIVADERLDQKFQLRDVLAGELGPIMTALLDQETTRRLEKL